jgi:hypothetical protein
MGFTLQQFVSDLAQDCDGARKQDKKGYNKPDAGFFHSINAVYHGGHKWSRDEISTVRNKMPKYAEQLSKKYTDDPNKRKNIELLVRNSIKNIAIQPPEASEDEVRSRKPSLLLSYGENYIDLYQSKIDVGLNQKILSSFSDIRHGERYIALPQYDKKNDKFVIPRNSTTTNIAIDLYDSEGVFLDVRVGNGIDNDLDEVLKHSRAAYFLESDGFFDDPGPVMMAVINFEKKNDAFVEDIKQSISSNNRIYSRDTDFSWLVKINIETAPVVAALIMDHKIHSEAMLVEQLDLFAPTMTRRF